MRVLRWFGDLWTIILVLLVLTCGALVGARWVLPLLAPSVPNLVASIPPSGLTEMPPRSRLTLRFDVPMNPRSVERAIRIDPPVAAQFDWDTDVTTLTISPTTLLQPDTTYTLTIGAGALSRFYRPVAAPIQRTFRTAPAPVVVMVLPPDGATGVATGTPISMIFSRPIVSPAAVGQPATLPELQFDPPLEGELTWIDPTTALFRPTNARPGTRYRATIAASLADVSAAQLGRPFRWSFSTPAPVVRSVTPANGANGVAGREPLVIRLSQPFDLADVQASLTISPTISGALTAAVLPDATQVITYTPGEDWRPDTAYTVELRPGLTPPGGNLPLANLTRWKFQTAPQPRVIGRFPGEGQTLPSGQNLRLFFSTPVTAGNLEAALSFEPPAGTIRVTTSGAEAQIRADLRAATVYTLTLPAALRATSGAPIGQEYRFRFVTASATPALDLPDTNRHVVRLSPGTAGLRVRRTNLSALNLDLYRLDEATVVRTFALGEDDWRAFSPERYGQPLLHAWSVQLTDPLNQLAESRVPLLDAASQPLVPGAYFLRLRTPEGPRADLLLLVSPVQLALQRSGGAVLAWARDPSGGAPIAGLPVALYQDGAIIRRGTTDANGLWLVGPPAIDPSRPYLALAGGDTPAVASSDWSRSGPAGSETNETFRAFVTTDRAIYRPGERVEIGGFVRAADGQRNLLPPSNLAGVFTVRLQANADRLYESTVPVRAGGVFSDSLVLPPDLPPGEYRLAAAFGGRLFVTTFEVQVERPPPLQVTIDAPPRSDSAQVPVVIGVLAARGLPVASATVTWTLSGTRAPFPVLEGYTVGDDERAAPRVARTGVGQTGPDGRYTLVISDAQALDIPLHYRLAVQVAEPGGPSAEAEGTFTVLPAPAFAALRLPGQVWRAGEGQTIELRAVTADGQPVPRAAMQVEVYRRTWTRTSRPDAPGREVLQPQDDRILVRAIRADDAGRAVLPVGLRDGGEYRLLASVVGDAGGGAPSGVSVWVAAPGFTGWRPEPAHQLRLIPDRSRYRVGETATLLPMLPIGTAEALVTVQRGADVTATVRLLRAGDLITVPLQPGDPPTVQVGLVVVEPLRTAGTRTDPPVGAVRAGTAVLPVDLDERALRLNVTTDQNQYAPGATATVTVTTTNDQGQGIPADLLVNVVGEGAAPDSSPSRSLQGSGPPPIITAHFEEGGPTGAGPPPPALPPAVPALPSAPRPGLAGYWNAGLRTSDTGVLTLTVRLPREPAPLQIIVTAASGPDRFAQAGRSINVVGSALADLDLPPLVRPGDRLDVQARLRNTAGTTQSLRVTLRTEGLTPQPGANLDREVALAPGAGMLLNWPMVGEEGEQAWAEIRVVPQIGAPSTRRQVRPIAPALEIDTGASGALVEDRWTVAISTTEQIPVGPETLSIAVAPSEAALARDAAERLAVLPQRDLLDQAGLMILSATVSDTGTLSATVRDRLIAAQNVDGGWGRWSGSPSEAFVTIAALDALATAGDTGASVADERLARGTLALRALLARPGVPATLRALGQSVLARYRQADEATIRALAGEPMLSAEGLAALLLARPPDNIRDRQLLDRLTALARREPGNAPGQDRVAWRAAPDGMDISSEPAATALAALALHRAGEGDNLLPAARRRLATVAFDDSASGYLQARVITALRMLGPEQPAEERFAITFNGVELVHEGTRTAPITSTRRLTVPAAQLRATNQLTITATGGSVFAAYHLHAAPAGPRNDGISILREYLDPVSGQPLDTAALRPGQLVQVRLTVVVDRPRRLLAIEEPLPGGMALVSVGTGAFESAVVMGDRLTLGSGQLAAGVYQHNYLLRATLPGNYTAPALIARSPAGAVLGVSTGATALVVR